MIIIALSGKKRSGKNTVAALAGKAITLTSKEYAFATALKEEVAKICGITVAELEANKELYRGLLQTWGEYRRKTKGEDYWIRKVATQLLKEDSDVVFITDLRYKNEHEFLRQCGAILIRVARDTHSTDNHPSETELDYVHTWHDIILNTSTLDHLALDVRELLTKLNIPLK